MEGVLDEIDTRFLQRESLTFFVVSFRRDCFRSTSDGQDTHQHAQEVDYLDRCINP